MEPDHQPGFKQQRGLRKGHEEEEFLKYQYQPLDAELSNTNANAVEQTRTRENPMVHSAVFVLWVLFVLLLFYLTHRAEAALTEETRTAGPGNWSRRGCGLSV